MLKLSSVDCFCLHPAISLVHPILADVLYGWLLNMQNNFRYYILSDMQFVCLCECHFTALHFSGSFQQICYPDLPE